MSGSGITIGPDPLVLKGNLLKNYNVFEEQFNKFYESKTYLHDLPESEKISFFLTTIGKDAREVYKTFELSPDDTSVTLKTVMERYKVYCSSYKDSSVYHSYQFYQRNQRKNESFENYLKDVFELAKQCHFNYDRETIERIIRDKVILGLSNSTIREEIFDNGFTKLEEIVNYCLSKDQSEPDASKESTVKDEKTDEKAGQEKQTKEEDSAKDTGDENAKGKEDENESEKNSGNAVTSSNDVLSASAESITDGNVETSDFDNSTLEKGEVSTSSFFDNSLDGEKEKNSTSPCKSIPKNFNIEKEISDADSSPNENESPKKHSEVIVVDSSDDEEKRLGMIKTSTVELMQNLQNFPGIQVKKVLKCNKCGKIFQSSQGLGGHSASCMKVPIRPRPQSRPRPQNTANNPCVCNHCGRVFNSPQALGGHSVKCARKMYGAQSPTKDSPGPQLVVQNAKRYICDICGKQFDRESKVSAHKAVSHNLSQNVYTCSKCPEKFNDETNLREHLLTHKVSKSSLGNNSPSDLEGLYRCALCRNHFKDYESLANHKHY